MMKAHFVTPVSGNIRLRGDSNLSEALAFLNSLIPKSSNAPDQRPGANNTIASIRTIKVSDERELHPVCE